MKGYKKYLRIDEKKYKNGTIKYIGRCPSLLVSKSITRSGGLHPYKLGDDNKYSIRCPHEFDDFDKCKKELRYLWLESKKEKRIARG